MQINTILCSVALMLFGSIGCSRPDYPATESNGADFPAEATSQENQDERLFIYSGKMHLVVENPDALRDPLQAVANKYEGYIQALSNDQVTLKVKAEQLEEAMNEIGQLGKVKEKSISGQDVTESYQDHRIRLENAEKYRLRYLELLEQAKNVEEILRIENELKRINEEIDLLSGHLKRLTSQIQLSTLVVTLERKIKPGPIGYVFLGLYKSVKWIFVRN
ncbi:MAG: DUF4349 domain-containing protein [Bacteroidia bacterium]|nr:DUF4349 domain-containing protein [Bacteroidia bacterium]